MGEERTRTAMVDDLAAARDQLQRFQSLGLVPRDGSFFPSILYPPMNQYPQGSAADFWDSYEPPSDGMFSVYLHVPFCIRHCNFCHLPVIVGAKAAERADYVETLLKEIELQSHRIMGQKIKARDILFGGGTPTHLNPSELERLFAGTLDRLEMKDCSQISVDLDPGTLMGRVGLERLQILKKYGVSRLAMGVQDLEDGVARAMGRSHNGEGAELAIARALDLGFKVNIEFIFGYPGQTLESWIQTIERAVRLGVHEIQVYRLEVTPYRSRKDQLHGVNALPKEAFPKVEETVEMLAAATHILSEAGYSENRRRFFTRSEEDFSHYQDSWTGSLLPQIGFGQTALSNLPDRVVQNHADLGAYTEAVRAGVPPALRGLVRDESTQLRWAFCMPLRHHRARSDVFERVTGRKLEEVFETKIQALSSEGLIERWEHGLRLTPSGSFWVNQVIQQFHHPDHLVSPREAYAEGPLSPYVDNSI